MFHNLFTQYHLKALLFMSHETHSEGHKKKAIESLLSSIQSE